MNQLEEKVKIFETQQDGVMFLKEELQKTRKTKEQAKYEAKNMITGLEDQIEEVQKIERYVNSEIYEKEKTCQARELEIFSLKDKIIEVIEITNEHKTQLKERE